MFHQTGEENLDHYLFKHICVFPSVEIGRYIVGCQWSKLIYFVVSRGEKLSCCLDLYVSLIDQSWNYNLLSVIQFFVLSSKYLMMVCVLRPAILDALKIQR